MGKTKRQPKLEPESISGSLPAFHGVEPRKVEKIVELKLSGLGFRAIGKQVELNKDKVREIWLKCEPLVGIELKKGLRKEPEDPEESGPFYAKAFSLIKEYQKKELKPSDIANELVIKLEIPPDVASNAVKSYFELNDLDGVQELREEIDELLDDMNTDISRLMQKTGTLTISGRHKRDNCKYFRRSDGVCTHWSWKELPHDLLVREALVKDGDVWCWKVSEYPERCATCDSRENVEL
jgi:hypothetical protein